MNPWAPEEAPGSDAAGRSERWQALSENVPVGLYVLHCQPDGSVGFVFASRAWLALLHLQWEAVQANPDLAFQAVHPEDQATMRGHNAACLASGEPFFWEGRLLVRGQVRWVRIQSNPTRMADGSTLWEGVMVDISDLKERELDLRRRETELHAIFNDLPVPIAALSHDPDPRTLFVNRRYLEVLGYTVEDAPTQSIWAVQAFPDPVERQRTLAAWDGALRCARLQSGSVESFDLKVRAKGGAVLEVLASATVLEDKVLVSLVDLSGQRRLQAELDQARRSLAETALSITEAIPVGTYTMVKRPDSPLASFAFMSERFLEICGLDREEARSDPLKGFACVHPDDFDDWVALNAHVFAHKLPFHGEARVIVKGEVRWILAESVPRDLPDGSTVWEGVIQDQTERVLAQQRLRESEESLRAILDNLPIPIGSGRTDDAGELLYLNRCFSESFGYELEEVPTLERWLELAYPLATQRRFYAERWARDVAAATAGDGRVPTRSFRLTTAAGRRRHVLISAVVFDGVFVASFLDFTEQRQAELALALARRRERQLRQQQRLDLESKLRSSLTAAAVAHEIQQPLSTLIIGAKLALTRLAQSSGALAQSLEPLLQSQLAEAEQLQQTTEKMRALLRNVQTPHGPVNLSAVVESALLFLERSLLQAGVQLQCRGLDREHWVMGDAARLQSAVANLLRNGLEALQGAGVSQPRLEVRLRRSGAEVELLVADNGPGFQTGAVAGEPLETTKPTGMGIGLFVVRTTVENHGGRWQVGRSVHGGAAVRLWLPAVPAPDPHPAADPGRP